MHMITNAMPRIPTIFLRHEAQPSPEITASNSCPYSGASAIYAPDHSLLLLLPLQIRIANSGLWLVRVSAEEIKYRSDWDSG